MAIAQYGSINPNAQVTPGATIQIVPPALNLINGQPTNVIGVVGTASWGPVNSPAILGSYQDAVTTFGPLRQVKGDLLTGVLAASLQGAQNFRGVRVTNGNDAAATITAQTAIIFTGLYTGTFGNNVQVSISPGSAKATSRVVVQALGQVPEVFDNISGGGALRWSRMADAINQGTSKNRGPSKWVVASIPTTPSTTAPVAGTYQLTGGSDGQAANYSSAAYVGADTEQRTGMYALRGTGCTIAFLADCDDATSFAAQSAFGLDAGVYMIGTGPAGDTVANATTVLGTSGVDSYSMKVMFGDWVMFSDQTNNKIRTVSPQGFVAGRLATLAPQESGLNKPIRGIIGTQKSAANQTYNSATLDAIGLLGLDLITMTSPGGNYPSMRFGQNTSSDSGVDGDNYTRMTNFLAKSLDSVAGKFVGQLQSDILRQNVRATIGAFLQDLQDAGAIGTADGSRAYSVVFDNSNNSITQVALGYAHVAVQVTYLSVVRYFILDLQGGQGVQVVAPTGA